MKTTIARGVLLVCFLLCTTPVPAQELVKRYFPAQLGDYKYFTGAGDDLYTAIESFDEGWFHIEYYYHYPGEEFEFDHWAYGIFGYSGDTLFEHGIDLGWNRYEWDPSLPVLTDAILVNGGTRTLQSDVTLRGARVPATVTIKIANAGAVTVPAGTYYNCRSVSVTAKAQGRSAAAQAYILAPHVGQIRIAVYNSALKQVGWQALVSGRVGGVDVSDYANRVPPSVVITSPRAKSRILTEPVTLTGTASDDGTVAEVWVQVNDAEWQLADGTTTWSADITPAAGQNTARAYALDAEGNTSSIAEIPFTYVMTAPVTIQVNGSGTVQRIASGDPLEVGRTYVLKARPAKGFKFTGWTGSATSTKRALRFVMQPGFTATANFEPK